MISIEIWNKQQLWSDGWINGAGDNEMVVEMLEDALEALEDTGEAGESFTLIARKME